MKAQYDKAEADQKKQLVKHEQSNIIDPKEKREHAFAELIRKTMAKENVGQDVYAALGDDDLTGSNKFLPKTVSTDIISAP